jgi:hypothetical protein
MASKIHPLMQRDQLTREILCWLLQRDTTGCFAAVGMADLARQFRSHDRAALDTALLALESRGLVSRTAPPPGHCGASADSDMPIGAPIAATIEAALQACRHATGYDIDDDAIRIARKFLKNDRYLDIPTLYDRLGWDLRRLNPPLLLMRSLLPEENFNPAPSRIFAFLDLRPTSQTRATLRAWVEQRSTLASAPQKAAMRG